MKYFISLTVFFVVLLFGITFQKYKKDHFFYKECEKVWAHRGYAKESEENSLEAFQAALALSAKGLEVDVFFDVKLDRFVVSHDIPYKVRNGKLLYLEDVLNINVQQAYVWLDFKNLAWLTDENTNKSLRRLNTITDKLNIKTKLLIESKNIDKLGTFSESGYNTSYWLVVNENMTKTEMIMTFLKIRMKYFFGDISAVSMNYNQYTQSIENILAGIPILLFTLNTNELVGKYFLTESVKVILSDKNYYITPECSSFKNENPSI